MKKGTLYNVVMFFALVGFLIGSYLTYTHYSQLSTFCLPGQEASCDIVLKGPYATLFFGIPNATIGAIGFALMFFAALAGKKGNKKADKILFTLALIAFLFILFLAYLIYFIIEAFCVWCFVAWICVIIIFLSSIAILKSKKKR